MSNGPSSDSDHWSDRRSSGSPAIGELLRERREARGWAQSDVVKQVKRVADKHDVSEDWLYKIEGGRLKRGKPYKPSPELLHSLARVYELNVDETLTWMLAADIPLEKVFKRFPMLLYQVRQERIRHIEETLATPRAIEFQDQVADEGIKRFCQWANSSARERKILRNEVSTDTKLLITFLIRFLAQHGPQHGVLVPKPFKKWGDSVKPKKGT